MSNVVAFPGVIPTARETRPKQTEPPKAPPPPCPVCAYPIRPDEFDVVDCTRCQKAFHLPCFFRVLPIADWLAYWTGREMAATEPDWRRPDPFRLPNGQLIGPGCVRSPGTDVSPKQSGDVRVSASLASGHSTASRHVPGVREVKIGEVEPPPGVI